MKVEGLKEVLELHKKWLNDDPDGVKADLRGADLRYADLISANLTGAYLYKANLTGADLTGANLTGADLRYANLRGADLRYADLTEADLAGANLTGAYLHGADLRGADLTGANLHGANLDYASFPLQCSSTKVKVDKKIFTQLLYHAMKICPDDLQLRKTDAWKVFAEEANKFHHVDECGKVG